MHQAETFSRTARKRDGATRKHQTQEIKTARAVGEQITPDRKRVETVVETLATLRSPGETLSEAAHDARNMVTALGLYCDLLEEPGVLATPFIHYGHELRLVAAASRRLVEKIVAIDAQRDTPASASVAGLPAMAIPQIPATASVQAHAAAFPQAGPLLSRPAPKDPEPAGSSIFDQGPGSEPSGLSSAGIANPGIASPGITNPGNANASRRWDLLPAVPVANLAAELLANRNLLAALAGPAIALTVHAEGGAGPVRLTGEDLTRILVNLVKNAAEVLPSGGRIHIGLREEPPAQGTAACLLLTVEDNGPGIPQDSLETVFTSGYTSHGMSEGSHGNWALSHRGLGLTITRSIVEGAGGRITAGNREHGGARFALELPLRRPN